MRAKLATLNNCAVPFLAVPPSSCAGTTIYTYIHVAIEVHNELQSSLYHIKKIYTKIFRVHSFDYSLLYIVINIAVQYIV